MSKFKSPFDNELWVTQNYHTNSSNRAIDISAIVDTPVHAIASGKITYRSSGAGSYCIQTIDDSDIKIYYVHTYKWLTIGTHVNQGDIICYIAPTSLNGGFPTHLHLGTDLNHNLMDYMDRNIVFRTKYSDIKADWFNSDGSLNWSLFKDLNYDNTSSANFKVGDRIIFREKVKIRVGSGLKYDTQQITTPNVTIATIIEGSRTADGYSWYNVWVDGGGSGWCAYSDGWFEIYVPPVVIPEPTPEPTIPEPTPESEPTPEVPTTPETEDNGQSGTTTPPENTDPLEPTTETTEVVKPKTLLEIIIQFFTDLLQILKNRTKL